MAYKTRLGGAGISFSEMMKNGFGIVTVMNAKVFDALSANEYKSMTAYQILKYAEELEKTDKLLATIDTLKVANVPQEGPNKTVTGGQFSNPLIKFGKSARLEMQDALGRAKAIEALGGGIVEYKNEIDGEITGLHFGEDFIGPKLIIGDSFFIDQKSGQQVDVKVIFYQFLPDSIFNLTQDAEGDATVFDMNGDLLTTIIKVADNTGATDSTHGVFYSIVDPNEAKDTTVKSYYSISKPAEDGSVTLSATEGYTVTPTKIEKDQVARVQVKHTASNKVVLDVVVKNY